MIKASAQWDLTASFLACMLEDLQLTENEEACSEGREARNTGSVYSVPESTHFRAIDYCARFMSECADHIATCQEAFDVSHVPDELHLLGFEYLRNPERLTHDGLGSTLWLAASGSGVTFTDDGNAPCLEAMATWACSNRLEAYLGDDGAAYIY